ncbi:MAG TPA: hypothetical protein DHW73_07470 [Pseudomonas sp.]|nr:hypothetical protein [Pseudomonas sp.]HCL41201.1 hypothetical protein [Pseudomonas sp.]
MLFAPTLADRAILPTAWRGRHFFNRIGRKQTTATPQPSPPKHQPSPKPCPCPPTNARLPQNNTTPPRTEPPCPDCGNTWPTCYRPP